MTVTLQQAKEQLDQLALQADRGEPVLIEREGAPSLLLTVKPAPKSRLGTLEGLWNIPEDIKAPFAEDIEQMFFGHAGKLEP